MALDVLMDGVHEMVQPSCLLQRERSFQRSIVSTISVTDSVSLQHSQALNTNALFAGWMAPWEHLGEGSGMVHSLDPDSVPIRSGLLSKLMSLPYSVQLIVSCVLLVAMLGFIALQRRSRLSNQGARPQGAGICFHVVMICISGFMRGYGLYVIGPYLTPIQRSLKLCFPCNGGESDLALAACSCPWKEFAVSSVALGAIFGGLAGGHMADAVGRRITLMASDVLFIVSSLMMALSGPGAWSSMFFVGRALAGVAVGVSGPASHSYIAEIVPSRFRGQLLTLIELALIAGVFAVFGFSAALGDEGWRTSLEFPALPAVFQLVCTGLFLHESPRWLAANGRMEEAEHVVRAMGLEAAALEAETENVRLALALGFDKKQMPGTRAAVRCADKRKRSAVTTLFYHRRRVALAVGCALAHNALGANTVMYYSRDILQLATIPNSAGSQIGLGVAKALGTGIAFGSVDKCGRRSLLIVGVCGCVLGHLGLAVAFLPAAREYAAGLAWASLLLFLAAWDLGWASLMSLVITEVLPDEVRGFGLGVSCSLYWLVSFVQAQTLETMFKAITIPGTFAMYCIGSILSLVFVLICVPETSGRPLEAE